MFTLIFSFSFLVNIKESSEIVFGVCNWEGDISYEVIISSKSELSLNAGVFKIDNDLIKFNFIFEFDLEDNILSFIFV